MKKSILKSLEPKSKSLFRFNNSDNKSKNSGLVNAGADTTMDPTTVTVITVSTF